MQFNRTTVIKGVIATIIIALLSVLAWLLLTRGFLVIETNDANAQYFIQHKDNESFEKTSVAPGSQLLASGTYTVEYKGEGGQSIKQVEIPNLLRSVTAAFSKAIQAQTEQIAIGTLDQITTGLESDFISINTSRQIGTIFRHPPDSPSSLSAQVEYISIKSAQNFIVNGQFIGLSEMPADSYKVHPLIYNFKESTLERGSKDYTFDAYLSLIPAHTSQGTFGVYYKQGDSYALDLYSGKESKELGDIPEAANGPNNIRLIGVSKDYIAVGTGEGYGLSADDERPVEKDFIIRLLRTKDGQEIYNINLGKTTGVSAIQVSPSGKYISYVKDGEIKVYDVEANIESFSFVSSSILNPHWRNDDKLLFGSVEDGIFEFNAREQSAVTLFAPKNFRISALNVDGDKLYFTAFTNSANATIAAPDGYVVYLDKPATDDNQLVTKLPFKDERIKVVSLGKTLYFAPTRNGYEGDSPEFFAINNTNPIYVEAYEEFLKDNIKDASQYKIVFGENL